VSHQHRIVGAAAPGRQRGMTLMEIIVVVVIVGLLAAIAVPSYRQYVIRTQRTDATVALLRLATAQEKFYLQNNTYADNALLDDDPRRPGVRRADPEHAALAPGDRAGPFHARVPIGARGCQLVQELVQPRLVRHRQ